MSTELYRPSRSILPYAGMITLTFGIMLLIFGGMIDGTTRHTVGPVLSSVTIPLGVGLIVFGSFLRKQARRVGIAEASTRSRSREEKTPASCTRCKSLAVNGAVYCRNCGQRL